MRRKPTHPGAVFREDVKMGPCARDIVENFFEIFGRLWYWTRRPRARVRTQNCFRFVCGFAYAQATRWPLGFRLNKTECFASFRGVKIVLALGLGPW